jgi:hypothetical protein
MSDIGLILELILKLLPIIKPSELEKLKGEIEKREKEIEQDNQDWLKAISSDTVDVAELNRIWAKRPRL